MIDKEPTLIEYASFFGSIQIIYYLKNCQVPLNFSLWSYTIHPNNAELIHFLEENEVKPVTIAQTKNTNHWFSIKNGFIKQTKNESFEDILIESIKCHQNDISNYIKEN